MQNQKLIMVPPIVSDDPHPVFWAERLTGNDRKRKVYCPLDINDNLSATARRAYSHFKTDEVHHCQCSDQCAQQMCTELNELSIVIAGCRQTDSIAQQIIGLVCGIKLPQPHLSPNQILIVRWYTSSYEITSPPLRLTSLQPHGTSNRDLVPR